MGKIKRFFSRLGPGLITGAADDDPAGIATYSLAGARFGYGLLWTAVVSFPLMTVIQETCGRIGLVTRKGLAGVIKTHYPRPILVLTTTLLFVANTFNVGADLSGMAAAVGLLLPVNQILISFVIVAGLTVLVIRLPYPTLATIFKWLTLALFSYLVTFLVLRPEFLETLKETILPDLTQLATKDYLMLVLAIFGTTISPYLFFWQTSEEAEEEKTEHRRAGWRDIKREQIDTVTGMFFSNLIMYFIIATTAATLFSAGVKEIGTAAEAAAALRPMAGDAAFILFALGIIGTGVLAVPVLAGSAAYAVAETIGVPEGLSKSFPRAKGFYAVIIISMALGFGLNFIGLSPITYLFYSGVLNGLIAPIMIGLLLLVANNKKIMGNYTNNLLTNTLTIVTLVIMTGAAIAIFII